MRVTHPAEMTLFSHCRTLLSLGPAQSWPPGAYSDLLPIHTTKNTSLLTTSDELSSPGTASPDTAATSSQWSLEAREANAMISSSTSPAR
ncbi:hypothetical protein ARMGADRAFT_127028 [Armillaria gallica]|uniref:Uncharacterized protein n=1 Tax=Armillaria gallica TaxID=47427 RepID=A0A2H3E1D8_ARMGA|nr:hypothetical protein ARMGADRAFT_127028 [Armillaria gallica]